MIAHAIAHAFIDSIKREPYNEFLIFTGEEV